MSFAEASAVRADGEQYTGEIAQGWGVGDKANGGYLLAIGARAMAAAAGRPHPVAVNAHYLSPGGAGPVRITPTVVKAGRRFSTVRASLGSAERPLVELLGSFGNLDEVEGPMRVDATPPELPPPGDCLRLTPRGRSFPPPLLSRVDLRLHPEDANFVRGEPTGRPLVRGWLRLPEGEVVDTFALLLAVDVFPPTIFNADLPTTWVPTLELSAHVRGVPEPGWLRCRFSTRFITGGMLEEDGEVWDTSGRLVAQSRQLALLPRPVA